MKFGIFYELQLPKPWGPDDEYRLLSDRITGPLYEVIPEGELIPELGIEVSVLTAPTPLTFANEAHALWQLRPHIDGVVIEVESNGQTHRSTFLPQVWAQMDDVRIFMAQLKLKAGLPADFWSPEVRVFTYQVKEF